MSQHDFDIANAPGATFRADVNAAIVALVSNSKGPSAPATPYEGQFWLDDDTPSSNVWTLWQYDGNDWIKLGLVDKTNNIAAFGGPSFQAHKNGTDQTGISSATQTKITFGTEEWDNGAHYDASNSKLIPTIAGKWRVSATIFWSANVVDGAEYQCSIYKNGSAYKKSFDTGGTGATSSPCQTVSALVELNGSTDYVEIYGYGGGAGNKTVSGNAALSYFSAEYVGP